MTYLLDFCIALITAIIGSFIFLHIVLTGYRPIILISPYIVFKKDNLGLNSYYLFKFVNMSRYPGYDVKIELYMMQRTSAGQGKMNARKTRLSVPIDSISQISKHTKSNENNLCPHALKVTCTADIDTILSDEHTSLQLQIMLRHGLSGLVKVFEMEYADTSLIKYVGFHHGDDLAAD